MTSQNQNQRLEGITFKKKLPSYYSNYTTYGMYYNKLLEKCEGHHHFYSPVLCTDSI